MNKNNYNKISNNLIWIALNTEDIDIFAKVGEIQYLINQMKGEN